MRAPWPNLAVRDTGLGTVESKIVKNQRKTFGTLRDLLRVRSVGIIEDDSARGLVKYAKPVGVVAAVCPSTNPVATPVNKAMMALKGGNAVIIAPSPSGHATTARTVELMRAELSKSGHPIDLVQVLPAPVTKELTQALVTGADLAVVTGSQDNVRRSMQSGTVTIGVGAGNVPVIVDVSADLDDAAEKIAASKIFDNATSCSSENALIVLDGVYEPMLAALERQGGHRASGEEKESILQKLWRDGKLNRRVIARDMAVLAREIGLSEDAKRARFVLVEDDRPGPDRPLSDEKLSLVLTVYRARDFDARQGARPRRPRGQGQGPFLRHPHRRPGPGPRAGRGDRRGARAGQPGPYIRQWRRLQQRLAVHAVDGLRHVAEQRDFREPELAPLHQRHPPGHHDGRGQAVGGGALRPLLGQVRHEVAMNFEEHAGKRLLAEAGLRCRRQNSQPRRPRPRPRHAGSALASSRPRYRPASAARPAASACRRPEASPRLRRGHSGMTIAGHRVTEGAGRGPDRHCPELYAAIVSDPASQGPLLLFSTAGGMDVEDMAEHHPSMHRHPISISGGSSPG
jgi:hypothetical protein